MCTPLFPNNNFIILLQSLLMVFAQLIQTQLVAVLNFLSSVPGPKGESGLHFVMTEWVSRQQMFYGSYENKVCFNAFLQYYLDFFNSGQQNLLLFLWLTATVLLKCENITPCA